MRTPRGNTVRGSKVKKLRKLYRAFVESILKDIPEGYGPISFRVFRKRMCAKR
jgi:hypothetical protein